MPFYLASDIGFSNTQRRIEASVRIAFRADLTLFDLALFTKAS
jgi:hypothetical protein